ncbi:MAG: (Fe-S)-binding protein [Chloroflexota bacterium]|nr:(Fe-S)-binding protein [Chloroflexota bacterium]
MAPNANLIGQILFLLILAVVAFTITLRVKKLIKALQKGQAENRLDELGKRVMLFIKGVLLQDRLWRNPLPGLAHFLTFWGFIIIQFGLIQFIFYGLTGLSIPFLNSRPFALALDAMLVLVLLSLIYFAYRRLIIRPAQLTTTKDAWIILSLITGVVVTLLLAEAFAWRALPNAENGYPLIGRRLAEVLIPTSKSWPNPNEAPRDVRDLAQVLWTVTWWVHVLIVMTFATYLPSSKHLHLLSSPFTTFFQNIKPKGALSKVENIEELEHYGANKIEDFTWKDLLDTYACTECGRCTAVCPAHQTGKPLNPKKIVIDLKTTLFAQSGLSMVGHTVGEQEITSQATTTTAAILETAHNLPPLVGGMITSAELWACTTCRACMTECPVYIEHVPKIVEMRRYLVMEESEFPKEIIPIFNHLERNGNPWPQRNAERGDWTTKLPFEVKVLAEAEAGQEIDVLFWTGCMPSFDARNKKIAERLAMILEEAGLNWGILGPEESCTGDPARRAGNEYLYQMLAQQNIEVLNGYQESVKLKKIVTVCPHCFNTLKNEYPQLGGNYEVIHHTQLIAELIEEGRIKVVPEIEATKVTFHDPCYLGRYNDIYDAPRFILNSLGSGMKKIEFVEMPRHRTKSFCCGGGGGRAWMEETTGKRINQTRIQEAADTGAEIVAAACPFCITMFEDGIKGKGLEEKMRVLDVTELIQLQSSQKTEPNL